MKLLLFWNCLDLRWAPGSYVVAAELPSDANRVCCMLASGMGDYSKRCHYNYHSLPHLRLATTYLSVLVSSLCCTYIQYGIVGVVRVDILKCLLIRFGFGCSKSLSGEWKGKPAILLAKNVFFAVARTNNCFFNTQT